MVRIWERSDIEREHCDRNHRVEEVRGCKDIFNLLGPIDLGFTRYFERVADDVNESRSCDEVVKTVTAFGSFVSIDH